MVEFCKSDIFNKLNVGVALDEGLASPTDVFTVFYGERVPWWIRVTAKGNTGHGSRFIENTAAEKLNRIVNRFLSFREEQKLKLKKGEGCGVKLGDVTTVNLSYLKGGITEDYKTYQMNIVPPLFEAGFDIRITPWVNIKEFHKMLDDWCSAEEGVTWECLPGTKAISNVITDIKKDNFWWNIFKSGIEKSNISFETEVFPASTDASFLRNLGYPAFGFSPINRTPILLHDHNEFLNDEIFIRGIDIYINLIKELGSVPSDPQEKKPSVPSELQNEKTSQP